MNEIFYEFQDRKDNIELSNQHNIEIILHFLAKIGDTLILYETKQIFSKSSNSNEDIEVITSLQSIFNQVDPSLTLIKGKIREIFLSYSS